MLPLLSERLFTVTYAGLDGTTTPGTSLPTPPPPIPCGIAGALTFLSLPGRHTPFPPPTGDPQPSSVGVRGMLFFLDLVRAAMDMGCRAEEEDECSMLSTFTGDWSSYVLVLPCLVMVRGEVGKSRDGWLNFLFGNWRSPPLPFGEAGMSLGMLESTVLSLGLDTGGVVPLCGGDLFLVGVAGWGVASLGVAGSGLGVT